MRDRIIFGCVALSAMGSRAEVFRLLDLVVASGVRHFDTARSYGKGCSEKLLGEFLRAHGEDLAVTTKFGVTFSQTTGMPTSIALPLNRLVKTLKPLVGLGLRGGKAENSLSTISDLPSATVQRVGREVVERSVEESLKQLGRGRVEILLLHEMLPGRLTEDARGYLKGLQKAGMVGQLGCGTNREVLERSFREDPMVEVLQYEGTAAVRPELMGKFPRKVHIHHSLFRGVGRGGPRAGCPSRAIHSPQASRRTASGSSSSAPASSAPRATSARRANLPPIPASSTGSPRSTCARVGTPRASSGCCSPPAPTGRTRA